MNYIHLIVKLVHICHDEYVTQFAPNSQHKANLSQLHYLFKYLY